MMLPDSVRFLEHQAQRCLEAKRAGDPDAGEALCLLVPALCRIFHLPPMTPGEALEFHAELKRVLTSDFRFDKEPSRVGCGGKT